jgi:MFS family permease
MAACIIVAQLVMVPVSAWAGPKAGVWGRKPVFLIAFLVLPIRGVLYVLSDNPYFLVSVQMLDGIGAGIFGVVMIIVIADLTKGTGRFNLTQGAIGTATGIGASLSAFMTGFVVSRAGYHAGFLTLAGVAAIALGVFWSCVPETRMVNRQRPQRNLVNRYQTP